MTYADSGLGKARLTLSPITEGPTYTTKIPMGIDSGECRLRLSPSRNVGRIRVQVVIQPDVPAASPRAVWIAFGSSSSESGWQSDTVRLTEGTPGVVDIKVASASAVSTEMAASIWIGNPRARGTTFVHRVLWSPPTELTLRTHTVGCGADVCFLTGAQQTVDVAGPSVDELDQARPVQLHQAMAGKAMVSEAPLRLGANGLYFVVPDQVQDGAYEVRLPLRTARFSELAEVRYAVLPISVRTRPPTLTDLRLLYAGSTTELQILRGASRGIEVAIPNPALAKTPHPLAHFNNGSRLQLREVSLTGEGPAVAELLLLDNGSGNGSARAIVAPLVPTLLRGGRDGFPYLVMKDGNNTTTLHARFTVTPVTRIDRYAVQREVEEEGAALHPYDTVRVRLRGPGVGYLTSGEFEEKAVHRIIPLGVPDALDVVLIVSRTPRNIEPLRMRDIDGGEATVDLRTEPTLRPRADLGFVQLSVRGAGPINGLRDTTLHVKSLRDVLLGLDDGAIDTDAALYGVQYLRVQAVLQDGASNEVGRFDRCIAVVPPPVSGRRYVVAGTCTPVVDGLLALSDSLIATARATARSTLTIRIRHEPTQYPTSFSGATRTILVKQTGIMVWEPRLALPSMLIVFQRGRTSPGVNYTGALFHVQPAFSDDWLKSPTHSLSAQFGFVLGTKPPTAASSNALEGQLSGTAGLTYIFRSMGGGTALDFFVGYVSPLGNRGFRRRDTYLVFRPGFSIPISAPGK